VAVRLSYKVGVTVVLPTMYWIMVEGGAEEGAIAYVLSSARYFLRFAFQAVTPAEERAVIQARNLLMYGDKVGPTFWQYFAQGRDFARIISGAMKTGGGDLGLF
jgi:hypothetical protein